MLARDHARASGTIARFSKKTAAPATSARSVERERYAPLSGDDPASARVESLWRGAYEERKDLDGDGQLEIEDTDLAHHYAAYVPHKGIWATVVLARDANPDRYVVANDRLYMACLAASTAPAGQAVPSAQTWAAHCRSWVTSTLGTHAKNPKANHAREQVLLTLAQALTSLLWTGHVKEARALFQEVDLPHFGAGEHSKLGKAAWWSAYVAGCRRSNYWDELSALFPALNDPR